MNRKIYSKVVVQWNPETNQYDTVVSEESFNYNGEMALAAASAAYDAGSMAAGTDPMGSTYDAASWDEGNDRSDYELGWLEMLGSPTLIGSDGPPSQDYQAGNNAAVNGWPYEGFSAYNEGVYAQGWLDAGGDPAETPQGGGGGGGESEGSGSAGSGSVNVDAQFNGSEDSGLGIRQGGTVLATTVSLSGSDNGDGAIGFDSSSATFAGLVARDDMGVKGALSVVSSAEVGGALTLYQGAQVTGDITTSGDIITTGAIEDPNGQNRLKLDDTNGDAGLDIGNTSIGDGKFQTYDAVTTNSSVLMQGVDSGATLDVDIPSSFSGSMTIEGDVGMTGDFTLQGNLSVAGTTTTVNSTAIELGDRIIDLAGDGTGFAGLRVKDSDPSAETSGSLVYDASANKWKAGLEGEEVELADLSSPQALTNKSISNSDLDLSGQSLTIDDSHADQIAGQTSTTELPEGDNLYHTTARARASVSVTDAGGDGSLAYNNSTGVITYTGPSAAEVRAHLSVADSNSIDMSVTAGEFSADAKVDDSSIEIDATNGLQVKALGVTNDMLAGSIASTKMAELNNFDTADLAEGSNLYFTEARARASLSVVNSEGDDSALSYDSATGVFTFDGVTEAEVRAHLGVADTNSVDMSYADGQFSADVKVNGITNDMLSGSIASTKIAELNNFDTADLAEGSNLYFTEARARASLSVTNSEGDDSALSYDAATGVFTFDGVTAEEVKSHFSAANSDADALSTLSYENGIFTLDGLGADEIRAQFSADMTSNGGRGSLAYDEASGVFSYEGVTQAEIRSDISVTDAGGDGSLAYNSGTGVITYTGPSANEVRAHLSATDTLSIDLTYADGNFKADAIVDNSSIETSDNGLQVKAAGITNDMLSGSIANNKLVNSSMTIAGDSVALGGEIAADTIAQAMSADIISGDQVEGGTIAAIQIDALTIKDSFVPLTDQGCALGSPTKRFTDVYTGDLHLRNERGNWTIFEEADHLRVRNNLTGQTFKMGMTLIEE